MKTALYARVSTRDKDQDPEVQLVKLRDFAARHGWVVRDEYTDFATGRDGNRPGLKKLLQDARAGKFDTVVIVRVDRIMRSLKNLYQLFQNLEAWDVRLVATDQDIDTNTTAGRLMLGLLGLLAQWEVEQTSDRVKDGLEKARRAGKRIGRPQARVDIKKAQALLDGKINEATYNRSLDAMTRGEISLNQQ